VVGMSKEDRFWLGKCGIGFALKGEGVLLLVYFSIVGSLSPVLAGFFI